MTDIKAENVSERKDPTLLLPEEPMVYNLKPKKKKRKKNQEDPFKDIEEKVILPTVAIFDPSPDSILDPEVTIKVENIEVELDFNDFANGNELMVEGVNSENSQPEPIVKLEEANKEATLLTFENIIYDRSIVHNETANEIAPNYVCKVCHLVFQTPKTLQMHQKRKHKVYRRSFTHICDYCGMSYETKNSLVAHMKRKHGPNSMPDDREERTCNICALVFKGMTRLRMHMQRKHGAFKETFKHVCEDCGLTYDKYRSLIVHIHRKHSNKKTPELDQWYSCPFCPKGFNRRETYARHVQRKHKIDDESSVTPDVKIEAKPTESGEVTCAECPLVFSSMNYLRLHMRRKHNALKDNFRLKCKICNLSYEKIESLKRHIRRKHDKGSYCDVCNKQFETRELYLNHSHEKLVRECPICGLIFASQSGLSKHLRCTHKMVEPKTVSCPICNEGFADKRQLKPHYLRVHLNVSYTCQYCMKVFKAKESYRRHIIFKHRNNKPTSEFQMCEQCSETFPDEFELSRHIDLVHTQGEIKEDTSDVVVKKEDSSNVVVKTEESSNVTVKKENIFNEIPNSFQCTKCPDNYKSWNELKLHYELNHYMPSQSQCQVCGEIVPDNELQKHIKDAHTDKNKSCRFCDFVTDNRASMTQHILRHKNATTLHCNYPHCRYKTFHEWAMDKHMRKHKDQGVKLQCSQCPFQTMNKYLLKYHEEAHLTGKKKYSCDQCVYSTALPASLVQHKYKHSTEKRFKCEVCPFATKYNTSLRFHVKKKHCDLPS